MKIFIRASIPQSFQNRLQSSSFFVYLEDSVRQFEHLATNTLPKGRSLYPIGVIIVIYFAIISMTFPPHFLHFIVRAPLTRSVTWSGSAGSTNYGGRKASTNAFSSARRSAAIWTNPVHVIEIKPVIIAAKMCNIICRLVVNSQSFFFCHFLKRFHNPHSIRLFSQFSTGLMLKPDKIL